MNLRVLFLVAIIVCNRGYTQLGGSNIEESKVPAYTLPDVLKMRNGKQVSSAREWNSIQRPYIYGLYEKYQFGKYPLKKINAGYRLLEQKDDALQGIATRKQVRIYLHPTDTSVAMDVLLYIPNHVKKPVAAFAGYNFSGNQTVMPDENIMLTRSWIYGKAKGVTGNHATNLSRGADSSQWQVKEILNRGYALVTACYGDLEADNAEGWKTGIRTTLKDVLSIRPEEWGAMGAWAWGLSRVMDYLEKDKDIDVKRVGVIGHSRLGKAALWAAASDIRFSLIVSNESGEGGAALSRRWFGETVKIITKNFPHWFVPAFTAFGDNVNSLPVDAHMLLSLMAPRPLYIASAEGDTWSDPKGEFLSAKEAGKVYGLFGKKAIEATVMPLVHEPAGGNIRYHIREGKHDVTLYDWQQYLNFAHEQWK